MSMLNDQVLRSELRHRYEQRGGMSDAAGRWARIEGWRGSRVARTRRRAGRAVRG